MISSTKIATSTKINLIIDSKDHKELFKSIKNAQSLPTDVATFKFLVENYHSMKEQLNVVNTQMKHLKVMLREF